MVRHVAHMGEVKNAYKILVGKPEGESLCIDGAVILKWIVECEDVDWIHLAEDRTVSRLL
jgi:hypothetical protein